MRRLLVLLLLAPLAACSSPEETVPTPDPPSTWIGLQPGDARAYAGDAGELTLVYVDETYSVGGENVSALTYEHDGQYVTDYFLPTASGIEWYGRKGQWRAGRAGESPRAVPLGDTVTFGDITLTLSDDGPPTSVETPDGVFTAE